MKRKIEIQGSPNTAVAADVFISIVILSFVFIAVFSCAIPAPARDGFTVITGGDTTLQEYIIDLEREVRDLREDLAFALTLLEISDPDFGQMFFDNPGDAIEFGSSPLSITETSYIAPVGSRTMSENDNKGKRSKQ